MRRLPVYFLLDCSDSMIGTRKQMLERGVSSVVTQLRKDPHALETVWLSVIAFAGIARTLAPLVELSAFYFPRLPIGGGTDLGAGLNELMDHMERSVQRTTPDRKGDWKPLVYLLTDGRPTTPATTALERWSKKFAKQATLVAVGIGAEADLSALRGITEHLLHLDEAHDADFTKFFAWITASVSAHHRSIRDGDDAGATKQVDTTILTLVKDASSSQGDPSTITFTGRCQKTRRPYLMRYDANAQREVRTRDFRYAAGGYSLTGCYMLDEDYFDWTDSEAPTQTVHTADLVGIPGCPHCGAASAFALCGCGKMLCTEGPGTATCPWCNSTLKFSATGDAGMDVQKGLG